MSVFLEATWLILLAGTLLALLWRSKIMDINESEQSPTIEIINAILPQSQCRRCGVSGCRPFAEALLSGRATIKACIPANQTTLEQLAEALGEPLLPLVVHAQQPEKAQIAKINEKVCIGCTQCISACPVDAIIGSHGMLHGVIEDYCTGCGLCLAPCPVDCISMESPQPLGKSPC